MKPKNKGKLMKGIITSLLILGFTSTATLTYLIWRARLYGGENWEWFARFNKYGEGTVEIIILTAGTIIGSISIPYFAFKYGVSKQLNTKRRFKKTFSNKQTAEFENE